jgi:hypothetical protein
MSLVNGTTISADDENVTNATYSKGCFCSNISRKWNTPTHASYQQDMQLIIFI